MQKLFSTESDCYINMTAHIPYLIVPGYTLGSLRTVGHISGTVKKFISFPKAWSLDLRLTQLHTQWYQGLEYMEIYLHSQTCLHGRHSDNINFSTLPLPLLGTDRIGKWPQPTLQDFLNK
jgi:hypothetical protein